MRYGKQSFTFTNPVYIRSSYSIVGPKEGDGNFAGNFDMVLKDDLWGEKSYEKAECKMHREAVSGAICKAGYNREDIDVMLAGDLLNELSASSLAARNFPTAFLGLYNACSTFSETILLGGVLIDAGFAQLATCSTSSHFSSAERQYRYPLELGNQRTPTAQWTITGAACSVLSAKKPTLSEMRSLNDGIAGTSGAEYEKPSANEKGFSEVKESEEDEKSPSDDVHYAKTHVARVMGGTFGRVIDLGIEDESNMGAAMAPAAADTLLTHFRETNTTPADYDAIFTGDLGRFGKELLEYLLSKEGITLPSTYMDCGASYFKPEQKTFQGGSGAGCVGTVFNGYILNKLENGTLHKILVAPTGALLNKDTPLQKETIPGISHAFVIETEELI